MKTYVNGKAQIEEPISRPPLPVFSASEAAKLVGSTPVPKYATWDAHRQEMRRAAGEAHATALARRAP
jgi:hypothetical protein